MPIDVRRPRTQNAMENHWTQAQEQDAAWACTPFAPPAPSYSAAPMPADLVLNYVTNGNAPAQNENESALESEQAVWPSDATDDYAWLLQKVLAPKDAPQGTTGTVREYHPMETLLEDDNDLFAPNGFDPAAPVSPLSLPNVKIESAADCDRMPKYRRRSETTCVSTSQPQLLNAQHSATSSLACSSEFGPEPTFGRPTSFMASRGSDSSIYKRQLSQPCPPPALPPPAPVAPNPRERERAKCRSGGAEKKNLLCAVCGDVASCQHYGVRTCEGCKGFFKRTVQKNSQYVCLASRNCPIDKRRRNKCQFCRYKKCLDVGMSRDVVRTDSLKGRRGRLPSQRQNSGGSSGSPASSPTSTPDESFLISILRAQTETTPRLDERDYSHFMFPNESQACSSDLLMENWRRFTAALTSSYEQIIEWSTKLTGFAELNQHDQRVLLSTAFLELLVLRIGCSTIPAGSGRGDESHIVFGNGVVLHKSQVAPYFGEWLEQIGDFAQSLQRLELDQIALSCMMALALITERAGLLDSNSVAELQLKVVESLRNYCLLSGGQTVSSPKSPPFVASQGVSRSQAPLLFSRILGKLPDLRSLSEQGLQKFYNLKMNGYTLPEQIDNMLFSNNGSNSSNVNLNQNLNHNVSYILRA